MPQLAFTNAQDTYRKQGILTANPVELIVMLYDGLKKNIVLARRLIERSDAAKAHKHLMKAQDIITELMNSLDMSFEISEDLLSIYEFMLRILEEANLNKDASQLEAIVEIVTSLRDTWQEVSEGQRGNLAALAEG